MSFRKYNVYEELEKLAKGKRTKTHPQMIAALVLGSLERPEPKPKKREDVDFLERLYRLEDPRG